MTRSRPLASPRRPWPGFTLVEMLVTLTLVGVLATVIVPFAQLAAVRQKETELRASLRTIRAAIDAYKAAADAGDIAVAAGDSGYPPSLEVLQDGVVAVRRPGTPADAPKKTLYFLRRVPRDPFWTDQVTPAAQTWRLRSYESPPQAPASGKDVYDIASSHDGVAIDGSAYASW